MRQFDVFQNPSVRSRGMSPFVVVLQSHLLEAMPTVVVAPMLVTDGSATYTRTSAKVEFQSAFYVVSAAELAAIEARRMTAPVGSLAEFEDDIRRALNYVFVGV